MGQQKPVKRQKKKTKEDLIIAEKQKQKEKNKLEARIEDATKNVPITEELRGQLGLEYQTDPQLVIDTGNDNTNNEYDEDDEPPQKVRKLNRKQKKRLQNYQERKQKELVRSEVMQSLAQNALTEEQMKLFYSTKNLGKRESAKEKLKRALYEERAGIQVHTTADSKSSSLHVEVDTKDDNDEYEEIKSSFSTANAGLDRVEWRQKNKQEKKTDEQKRLEQQQKKFHFNKKQAEAALAPDEEDLEREKFKKMQEEKEKKEEEERLKQEEEKKKKQAEKKIKKKEKRDAKKLEEVQKNQPQTEQQQSEEEDSANSSSIDPLSQVPSIQPAIPAKIYYVNVNRPDHIQAQRLQLPVVMEEQRIMECIKENDVTIICGETGSGKTTQVPQFLYEAGFGSQGSANTGMIGVTEPRRVAAMSMAKRVAYELNLDFGKQVGYQIRYDSTTVTPDTVIKFMTDGILLKEIQSDFLLRKYSVIIIDEAHERSLNTDILIGLLSRIVPLRSKMVREQPKGAPNPLAPLRLIIMSATLRVEDFTKNSTLFPVPPPVVEIGSRQFPVTIHFNKKTPEDYVADAYRKICKMHKKLPSGGILVFLTGQQEIEHLCKKLRKKFPYDKSNVPQKNQEDNSNTDKKPSSSNPPPIRGNFLTTPRAIPGEVDADPTHSQSSIQKLFKSVKKLPTVDYDKLRKNTERFFGSKLRQREKKEHKLVGAVQYTQLKRKRKLQKETKELEEWIDNMEMMEQDNQNEEEGQEEVDNDNRSDNNNEEMEIANDEKDANDNNMNQDQAAEEASALDINKADDADIHELSDSDSDLSDVEEGESETEEDKPLLVLPLYSLLPTNQQLRVFDNVPEGVRLCVVATNVAETSLTIPGIKYVVDTGKVKELHYEQASGISQFVITWTSQASANQRSGRAGRTAPGHCYRLYSSAVYQNQFQTFSPPEIMLTPIEGVVLQMKNMGIDTVLNFPFPTPPQQETVHSAVRLLKNLGALDLEGKQAITKLGRTLAYFPLAPRFSKMLVLGKQGGCLPYVIAIVACLSVRDPILRESPTLNDGAPQDNNIQNNPNLTAEQKEREERKQRRLSLKRTQTLWFNDYSDILASLKAVGAFEYSGCSEDFCNKNFLHFKTLQEIHSLRNQLTSMLNTLEPDLSISVDPKLEPPSKSQETILRQIITAGLIDQVACLQRDGNAVFYQILNSDDRVYIHPSSYMHDILPDFCTYREIMNTSRPYMKGVTAINPMWLAHLGAPLCHFSKPMEYPPPRYNAEADQIKCYMKTTYGPKSWELPLQELEHPEGIERYRLFARYLLEGAVFPKFQEFMSYYEARPVVIVKEYNQPKVLHLVNKLKNSGIDTKQKLAAKWKQDRSFLLNEVKAWVWKQHHKVLNPWPPVQASQQPAKKDQAKPQDTFAVEDVEDEEEDPTWKLTKIEEPDENKFVTDARDD